MKIKYILTFFLSILGAIIIGYLLFYLKSIWLFLLVSLGLNLIIATFCLISVPKNLKANNYLSLVLLLTLLASFVPLLVPCLLGIAAIASNWFAQKTDADTDRLVKMPEFIRDKIFAPKFTVDESKMREALSSEFADVTKKINALSSMNLEASSRTNLINRALLSETSDEVRLLAFSFLAKQENEINEQINTLLNKLKIETNDIAIAKIHKYLALQYWKLVDLNLVQKDFLDFIINKAFYYTDKALKQFPEDNTLWVLLGRIYIVQNKISKAYDALNRATRLHASDRKVLPYLAELSFKNKNYAEAKDYLFMNDNLRDIFFLFPIVSFWEQTT